MASSTSVQRSSMAKQTSKAKTFMTRSAAVDQVLACLPFTACQIALIPPIHGLWFDHPDCAGLEAIKLHSSRLP